MANDKNFKIKNGLSATQYLQSSGTTTSASNNYQVSTATYEQRFSVGQNTRGAAYKSDGTKMFVTSSTGEVVREYTLSTAYDVSTASYVNQFTLQGTSVGGTFFKPDGTKFWNVDQSGNVVYQYSMSTAWDITTASYDSVSFSVSQDNQPMQLYFKSDGTKMYIAGGTNDTIYQYSLSTAWNLSTASYDSVSVDNSSRSTSTRAVSFNGGGTEMYVGGGSSIYIFDVSTAWNISTATYNTSVSTNGANTADIQFGNSGAVMIVADGTADAVDQYSTGSSSQTLDLSTGSFLSFTQSGSTTVSFTNPPSSGTAIGFLLSVTGDGSALTWPSSVKWEAGETPDAPASGGKNIYAFVTADGGTTYYGKLAGDSFA